MNSDKQLLIFLILAIPLEIIALQLDIDLDEVNRIIQTISDKYDIEKKYQIDNYSNCLNLYFI